MRSRSEGTACSGTAPPAKVKAEAEAKQKADAEAKAKAEAEAKVAEAKEAEAKAAQEKEAQEKELKDHPPCPGYKKKGLFNSKCKHCGKKKNEHTKT